MNSTESFYAWLLASTIPSIRYLTYVNLLGYSIDDARTEAAHRAVMDSGPVPDIFASQTAGGAWAEERTYYSPKYVSTHWSLLLLMELAVDAQDPRFQRGVDFMLDNTATDVDTRLNTDHLGFSCLWGNILRYALYAGRGDDMRVARLLNYAVNDLNRGPCQCQYNDGHACAWGVARTLWGVATVPAVQRTPAINAAIARGTAFLLDSNQLVAATYPTPDKGKVHPLWFKLNFPLFYQVDILFTLRVLADINSLDHPQAQRALDWLLQQRQATGHWYGRSPYRQRTWPGIGDREETNRWVSLQSAMMLKQAGRGLNA